MSESFVCGVWYARLHPLCRSTAFMSHALTSYLHRHGVACSKTSVYNAPGNG